MEIIASRRCRVYEKTVSFQLLAFKLTHTASEKSHEQSFVTIICESQMHEVYLRDKREVGLSTSSLILSLLKQRFGAFSQAWRQQKFFTCSLLLHLDTEFAS